MARKPAAKAPAKKPTKKPAKKAAPKPPPKKRGRKSTYDQAVAETICAKLSEGIPLAVICRGQGMPAVRTVSDWKAANEEFAAAFTRAREEGFDAIAAECLAIADETSQDTVVGERGQEMPNAEWISRSRLRVETRLKLLAKWDPKRYGEKVSAELTGKDGKDLPAANVPAGVLVVPGMMADTAAWAAAAQKATGGGD